MNQDFLINFGIFQASVVELSAVLSGLVSVWLVKKENVWAFPIGGVSVLLSAYIYFKGNIYANAGINVFYFIMNIYGWYNWLRKVGGEKHIMITSCSRKEMLAYAALIILLFLGLWYILGKMHNNEYVLYDSFTSALYAVAMWLMARKKIQHWPLWIIGDVIMIVLCILLKWYFIGFQYLVYTVIAVLGWMEWKYKIKGTQAY
ncbi:MAG: nicotinamide riboside transporter PnuC [Bacteroidetes bacterium]|nr:nicotinamide riboside transporter PnuC [Bacteroidota bacterium]